MKTVFISCCFLALVCGSCGKFKPFTADKKANRDTLNVSVAVGLDSNKANNIGLLASYALNGLVVHLTKVSGADNFPGKIYGPWNIASNTDTEVVFSITDVPNIVAGYGLVIFEDDYVNDPTTFTIQRAYFSAHNMPGGAPLDFTNAVENQVYTVNANQLPACTSPSGMECLGNVTFKFCKLASGSCPDGSGLCGIRSKVATSSLSCADTGAFGPSYTGVTSGDVYTNAAIYGRYPTKTLTPSGTYTISNLMVPYQSSCSLVTEGAPVEICFFHSNGNPFVYTFDASTTNIPTGSQQLCDAAVGSSQTIFINTSAYPNYMDLRPLSSTYYGMAGSSCSQIPNFNRALTLSASNVPY